MKKTPLRRMVDIVFWMLYLAMGSGAIGIIWAISTSPDMFWGTKIPMSFASIAFLHKALTNKKDNMRP